MQAAMPTNAPGAVARFESAPSANSPSIPAVASEKICTANSIAVPTPIQSWEKTMENVPRIATVTRPTHRRRESLERGCNRAK